jgi:DNA-binding transcriptional ArsR family regulator
MSRNIGSRSHAPMHSASRSLLWYLLVGTRGGPNRYRILEALRGDPHNANQLAELLRMDYRTIRHHLNLLERNGLVQRPVGHGYAAPYELSPDVEVHFEEIRILRAHGGRARRTLASGPFALDSGGDP